MPRPKNKIFVPQLTKDLAYFCGVLAGDGSIYQRKSKNDYIIKCVGNPKDEKEYYTNVIKPLIYSLFHLDIVVKEQDQGTTFGFVCYSKALFEFLTRKIGLPSGSKYNGLTIPSCFKKRELCSAFIQGVADTDFCISFKKKYSSVPYYPVISGSSKSKSFMREIVSHLKKEGFKVVEIYDYCINDSKGYQMVFQK